MKGPVCSILLITLLLFTPPLFSQEFGFGFGDASGDGTSAGSTMDASPEGSQGNGSGFGISTPYFSASLGGEVRAEFTLYPDDLSSSSAFENMTAGDIFSGNLSVSASSTHAEAYINMKLVPDFSGSTSPISFDEAYARFFFGPAVITGGIKKLSWGKADSRGVLDVTNPYDYTDLSNMFDLSDMKIGRPLFHASFVVGTFSVLEGVFIPWFEGHRFPSEGRWMPAGFAEMYSLMGTPSFDPANIGYANTKSLKYAQAGLRFTTTLGESDFGVQYFFGNLMEPSVKISGLDTMPPDPKVRVDYDRYHQIGLDFARVIAGFNLRAEAAFNLTEDYAGDDPAVYNPFIAWNVGFDRILFAGINLNLQGNGKIRLMDSKLTQGDIEADASVSQSFITAVLSRKFLRDELETQLSVNWGIEDRDVMIMPALIWTKNDIEIRLLGGIFAGDKEGSQGQFYENGFIKLTMGYSF